MAETMTIDRRQWVVRLDAVTREREGEELTVEVLDKDWVDPYEAQRMPFSYVSYARKDDVVIGVGGSSASRTGQSRWRRSVGPVSEGRRHEGGWR